MGRGPWKPPCSPWGHKELETTEHSWKLIKEDTIKQFKNGKGTLLTDSLILQLPYQKYYYEHYTKKFENVYR